MIYVKKYDEPKVNISEIQRYAGCTGRYFEDISACLSELSGKLCYKICYTYLSISDEPVVSWIKESNDLRKNLDGCNEIVLFGATVGLEPDRLIARYGRIAPSKALFFQAIGAERIEALCDEFNREINSEALNKGLFTRPRFSPGYGDFSIDAQADIFRILDCPRKIGVSLNDSFLMSPSKSVTAVIGISYRDGCKASGCKVCNKTDCNFRR